MNRETWLQAVTDHVAPWFAALGKPLPKVRMAVGFTSHGSRGKRIGECWTDSASADGTHEIFITPLIDDATEVAAILVHELVHAAVGIKSGHGPRFRKVALAVGLVGKMTATTGGPKFLEAIAPILEAVGPMPHKRLSAGCDSNRPKKQSTRMIKCACPECGYTVRTTAKWLEVGAPICPTDGNELETA